MRIEPVQEKSSGSERETLLIKEKRPMLVTSREKLMIWIVYTLMVFNVGFVCGKTCYHHPEGNT